MKIKELDSIQGVSTAFRLIIEAGDNITEKGIPLEPGVYNFCVSDSQPKRIVNENALLANQVAIKNALERRKNGELDVEIPRRLKPEYSFEAQRDYTTYFKNVTNKKEYSDCAVLYLIEKYNYRFN